MIILIIQVYDFFLGLVNLERNPPIAGDRQAPGALAIPAKLVRLPTWNGVEFFHAVHFLQEGDDVADSFNSRSRQPFWVIPLDEMPQSAMNNISNLHS